MGVCQPIMLSQFFCTSLLYTTCTATLWLGAITQELSQTLHCFFARSDTSKRIWSGCNQDHMAQSAQNKGTDSAWTWSASHSKYKRVLVRFWSQAWVAWPYGHYCWQAYMLHFMPCAIIWYADMPLLCLSICALLWSGLACSPFAVDKSKFRTCELDSSEISNQICFTLFFTRFLSVSKARLFLSKISQVHWQGCHSFTRNMNHVVLQTSQLKFHHNCQQ